MDHPELAERLHALQLSLKDGDDLAKAISLIGDALERRMHGIRESLEDLRHDGTVPDVDRLDQIIGRVGSTLDDYEDKLEERRQRMQELIEEFQESLGEEAVALGDLEAQLQGAEEPGGDEEHLPDSEDSGR